MEQTFMTIHNLSPEANILFASESIYDILGYHPHEVQNRSCFDYFHPEEVPFAKSIHSRGVLLDKAAVLHYARILSRDGQWISCECCFTVVHDVLVACTSVYHRGEKSDRRALEAPQIRRLFSCSPRDPRYHMLEYLSPKFRMPTAEREPRAALILNRFTRTLTVMFATNAVANILGVDADTMRGKSFYECIQENCLPDAIRCLESAKANDSIAYLRFWYRDPRRPGDLDEDMDDVDGVDGPRRRRHGARASTHSSDSEGGGAQLYGQMDVDGHSPRPRIKVEEGEERPGLTHADSSSTLANPSAGQSGSSSGHVQTPASPPLRRNSPSPMPEDGSQEPDGSFELEAVVSCTSDGLVVVLRKARPAIPSENPPAVAPRTYQNGVFAAPWGHHAVGPWGLPAQAQPHGNGLFPQHVPPYNNNNNELISSTPSVESAGGPPLDHLMRSIREVAVFAWALVGINGNLATYGRGKARGEARPAGGLPVWDPAADGNISYGGPENQAVKRWAAYDRAKRAAPSAFNGPYQLSRVAHHAPNPVDSGYSTQGSVEQFGYAEPPSVRQAWARYRQQQLQHQVQDHQQQQQPPAYQEYQPSSGYSYGTPSWNGPQLPYPSIQAEPYRYGPQPPANGHDQRPRYQPEYPGQPWAQDPEQPQPDGSGHFDVSSNGGGHGGHDGQSQSSRFPWN